MLDVGARVSPLVIRDMVVTVLLNALLALPVFVVVRRVLRPSLAVDPLELGRRRQAPRADRPARPARPRDLMYLDDDRRPTLTPQLAVRVALIGGVALVAFAVIFFRLWYLQVLSGDHYLAEARDNRVREIKVQAPRGEIVDRDGRTLVDNRPAMAVVLSPDRLPEGAAERRQRSTGGSGGCSAMRPRAIERRRGAAAEGAPVLHRHRQAGRVRPARLVPARAPATSSAARTWSASSCASTRTTRSARTCSARSAR